MNRAAAPARSTVEFGIAAGLLGVFWLLYGLSIGRDGANLQWYNFVFDADPGRVLNDAINGRDPVSFARHPLTLLVLGTLGRLFAPMTGGVEDGVQIGVALLAAGGVGAAYLVFRAICDGRLPALLLAVLYGGAASVWLMGSIPETFAINSALIAGVFLVHRPEFAQPLRHRSRFALNVMLGALATGMVVTHLIYPFLGFASNLRRAQPDLRRRLVALLAYGALCYAGFVALGAVQSVAYPMESGGRQVAAAPLAAAGEDTWLRLDRPFAPADAARLVRAFVSDAVVAPPAEVTVVHADEGALQMIQFGGPITAPYLLAVLGLAILLVGAIGRARLREVAGQPTFQLAAAFLGWNLVFHWFYANNGQPLIFTTHAVFPVLVIVAHLFAASAFRWRTAGLAVATGLVVANNVTFVRFVNEALRASCGERLANVCLTWRDHANDPRYTAGLATYLESADHQYDLGRMALMERRVEESDERFRSALARDPGHLGASMALGYLLIQMNQAAEAERILSRAQARYPKHPILRQLLDDARRRR